MEETKVITDIENRYNWDQISSVFVDGILAQRSIIFDNQTMSQSSYSNGVITNMLQIDGGMDGGAKPWSSKETFYSPDGTIAGRITMYDNGVIRDETFTNGVRSEVAQYDNPQLSDSGGAKSWDSIVTYYNPEGQMAGRITVYDDGVLKEETFENGVRSHVRQLDNPQSSDGNGARSWDSIDAYFDAEGDLVGRITVMDNGIVREEEFANGVRVRTVQIDNPQAPEGQGAKNWDRIETYYDDNGQKIASITTYDDGRVRQDTFENGVRSTSEIQDSPYDGQSKYSWTAINMYYDENGKLAQKITVFDDGRVREDDFADGVRTSSKITDMALFGDGNYEWDTLQFTYDENGDLSNRATIYDDGDVMLQDYEAGQIAKTFLYDGDGDEEWLGHVTTYDQDGAVASTQALYTQEEVIAHFAAQPVEDALTM